jgi:sirohydrochlorin ferrochelatase
MAENAEERKLINSLGLIIVSRAIGRSVEGLLKEGAPIAIVVHVLLSITNHLVRDKPQDTRRYRDEREVDPLVYSSNIDAAREILIEITKDLTWEERTKIDEAISKELSNV